MGRLERYFDELVDGEAVEMACAKHTLRFLFEHRRRYLEEALKKRAVEVVVNPGSGGNWLRVLSVDKLRAIRGLQRLREDT